ncbi:MAG: DNA repair protein RecN [Chitinophagales bacterium]
MLRKLSVRNYAIIDHLELSFSDKLTVITGETGAGKSIAIEALSLVLGERADASVLFEKEKKCIVEATFDAISPDLKIFFEENDLDLEEQLILRREILAAGKSRAFINDTPVNLSVMKSLGDQLVDMHNQHESQELSTSQFQITLLDSLAKQESSSRQFRTSFFSYQENLNRSNQLREQHLRETQELDYLSFQLDELTQATLNANEQESAEQELKQLEHAEEIKKLLAAAYNLLQETDSAVKYQLKEIIGLLNSAKKYFYPAEGLTTRLESLRIELQDISDEIENNQSLLNVDPERLQEINQRLDIIYRLQKKHRVDSVAALQSIAADLELKIQSISIHTDELENLDEKLTAQKNALLSTARKISAGRKKQIPVVAQTVNKMLRNVGMPYAEISIEQEVLPADELNMHGIDRFHFLFASNKGSALQDIRKVASGGELSRLMLCIKSLIADSTSLPTLIFDEIDTGISGETAMKVSAILKELANNHQVICITHLPQIAAKGDLHYFVFKETSDARTFTRIRKLDQQEKIKAIAQMISGEKVTPAALESAKELLN